MRGTNPKGRASTAFGQVRLRDVLRYIGKAERGKCGVKHLKSPVEDQLAFDMHFQLATIPLEFPGVETPRVGSRRLMQL
jgi:hypothetical protein